MAEKKETWMGKMDRMQKVNIECRTRNVEI